jgi:sugar O-acyltransferase (sialic acid O-acetyltransferase NeuD family)
VIRRMQYVLWGSAGHAKVLADVIELRGDKVVALFDNSPNSISCLPGVPLFYGATGFQEWVAGQPFVNEMSAALAIGGARGKDRQELAQMIQARGLTLPAITHPTASVSNSVELGQGCQILANAVVAPGVSMGCVCIVNNSANVDHECKLGHGVHVAPGAVLCGDVVAADNAMIGAGAVVLPRLRIGIGAVVGAGAVVTCNVPDGAVVVGNPARIIGNSK